MQAIVITRTGGPEVLQYCDNLPEPEIGFGQVLVQNAYAGVNFVDTYYRAGSYRTSLPFVPGLEGAGIVAALGPGVTDFQVGDRVVYAMQLGSYAALSSVPIERLYRLPNGVDFEVATAHFLQGATALFLSRLADRTSIEAGGMVVIRGAGCSVGRMLILLLKRKGIRVLATTRSLDKFRQLKCVGADEVVLDTGDARALFYSMKEYLPGGATPVFYDSVAGPDAWSFLPCLQRRGLYVMFGQSAGSSPLLDPQALRLHGSLFVTRPSLTHYLHSVAETRLLGDDLFAQAQEFQAFTHVDRVFSLADADEAHRHLYRRKTLGKVLLSINPRLDSKSVPIS